MNYKKNLNCHLKCVTVFQKLSILIFFFFKYWCLRNIFDCVSSSTSFVWGRECDGILSIQMTWSVRYNWMHEWNETSCSRRVSNAMNQSKCWVVCTSQNISHLFWMRSESRSPYSSLRRYTHSTYSESRCQRLK